MLRDGSPSHMRLVVLAHDAFDPKHAKTAHCVVRYARLVGRVGDKFVAVARISARRGRGARRTGDRAGLTG